MTNQGKTFGKIPKRTRFTLEDSTTSNGKYHKKSIGQKSRQNRKLSEPTDCDRTQIGKLVLQDDESQKQEPDFFSKRPSVSNLEEAGSTEEIPTLDDIDASKAQLGQELEVSERGENNNGQSNNGQSNNGQSNNGQSNNGQSNNGQDNASVSDTGKAEKPKREIKHIHPCICDLSASQRHRIRTHVQKTKKFENRLVERLEEIDLERIALEEEIRRKEAEELEQQELFGDQYEVIGKKKKRLKRSARRASMVSLGVKTVINWRKSPKIKVKYNKVSELRRSHSSYCGERPNIESPVKNIGFENSPRIPVRITKTTVLRTETNLRKKEDLLKMEDKRPRFIVAPPV